jgi:hypothetical protein
MEELRSIEQVAVQAGRAGCSVWDAVRAAILPSIRIKNRRMVKASDADAWISNGCKTTRIEKSYARSKASAAK